MTRETLEDLNANLIGFTDKRGTAWHYRANLQGAEPNHYPGAIPVADVRRRLFNWKPAVGTSETTYVDEEVGDVTLVDATRQQIIRPDTQTVRGVFKQGYKVHDYSEWLLDGVEEILSADIKIGSAGLLKKGAVAWVQVEMEDTLSACGVEFRPFLTAGTSLDGSMATNVITGAQAVVCDNTYDAAQAGAARAIRVKHSTNSGFRLDEVRAALDIVEAVAANFTAQLEQLTAEVVSPLRFDKWVDAYTELAKAKEGRSLTMAQSKGAALRRLWANDERVAPWKGTAWGVLAAASTYVHHVATVKGASHATRNAERMVYGQTGELDRYALKVLAAV
jgi:phage/plasmid-like protein (TIGR03299 family)